MSDVTIVLALFIEHPQCAPPATSMTLSLPPLPHSHRLLDRVRGGAHARFRVESWFFLIFMPVGYLCHDRLALIDHAGEPREPGVTRWLAFCVAWSCAMSGGAECPAAAVQNVLKGVWINFYANAGIHIYNGANIRAF